MMVVGGKAGLKTRNSRFSSKVVTTKCSTETYRISITVPLSCWLFTFNLMR